MPTEYFDRDLESFFSLLQRNHRERILEGPPAGSVDLCSNDYLCLSQHPAVVAALHEGIDRYGAGSTASRLVRGHREVFDLLEKKTAEWQNAENALFFANGYAANVGTISAVCDGSYEAFIDRLAHASLVDGVRLSGARKTYFRHNDCAHLEQLLQKSTAQKKIIISESIFSMDGDTAPVRELEEMARRHNALLYIDDAHATGVAGEEGRGLAGVATDFRLITFGKALGLEGAAVVCSERSRRYLLHNARTFVFSTAPLPAVAHAAQTALQLARGMENERRAIWRAAENLRSGIRKLGYSTQHSTTQIVPLLCDSEEHALALAQQLSAAGFHAKAIRPPTVKESRIRFSVNAGVTEAVIDNLLAAIAGAGICR